MSATVIDDNYISSTYTYIPPHASIRLSTTAIGDAHNVFVPTATRQFVDNDSDPKPIGQAEIPVGWLFSQ